MKQKILKEKETRRLRLEMLEAKEELYSRMARYDYAKYVEYTEEGRWIPGKHLVFACNLIDKFLDNQLEEQILIFSMPPQHGKSETITAKLPSYYVGRNPNKRVFILSYGEEFASRFGMKNKSTINKYGKRLFDIEIDKDKKNTNTDFAIKNNTGEVMSRGLGGTITGLPCDLAIIDDPIKKPEEAYSDSYCQKILDIYLWVINTRLSAEGKVIIMATRWCENDLIGKLTSLFPEKCKVINIPCEAEENDILGRNVGDSLFPEIGKDNNWLKRTKQYYFNSGEENTGVMAWNCMFQGRPTSLEGNMVKRNWWKYYDTLPQLRTVLMSVDASFKDDVDSDFNCIMLLGKRNANIYIIDVLNKRMSFPETLKAIQNTYYSYNSQHPNYPIQQILVEDKANGSAIIQVLRTSIMGVVPIQPEGGKIARLNSVAPLVEAGNIYLPRSAEWLNQFLDQMSSFPKGKNDDIVDAFSQGVGKLRYYFSDIEEFIEPQYTRFNSFDYNYQENALSFKLTKDFWNYGLD